MPNAVLRTLSKSDFKVARDCPTKLYYRESGYYSTDSDDEYMTLLAEGGYMVEQFAKLHYPAGIELPCGGDPAVAAAVTMEKLKQENITLFEPTLLSGNKLARVDILVKRGNKFRLIEVKAKSFSTAENGEASDDDTPNSFRSKRKPHTIRTNWLPYLEDVTYQVLLLQELFPSATIQPFLCMIDKEKKTAFEGLPALFEILRSTTSGGQSRVSTARFVGTAADASRLRKESLIVECDVSSEVDELKKEVAAAARKFAYSLRGKLKKIKVPIGWGCRDCDYRLADAEIDAETPSGFNECWGALAKVKPSILDLYKGASVKAGDESLVDGLIANGKVSLYDVPKKALRKKDGTIGTINQRQLIQIKHTKKNTVFIGGGIPAAMKRVRYPLHFIDFETSRMALPYHAGMRPYGQIAFQWSCHTQRKAGAPLEHQEWLNDSPDWPNAEFARSLRKAIGDKGTVLTWSKHESSTLRKVAEELESFGHKSPTLAKWIGSVIGKTDGDSGRILDMHALTEESFWHPGMAGRTSIKIVLDALWRADEKMRKDFEALAGRAGDPTKGPYAALPLLTIDGVEQHIAEGTGAMRAYEAISIGVERNDSEVRAAWRKLLLQYCALDTLAMVLIWKFWERARSR